MAVKRAKLTGEGILTQLIKCGITHIIWLPDSEVSFMYPAMMNHKEITLVPVCREGEAAGIATGLVLGGKKPATLFQCSGLYEAGDGIRALLIGLELPVLMMVGYRGWKYGEQPMTDSAGTFLEPTLDAWGIPHYIIESDEDLDRIAVAYQEAVRLKKPVAILIPKERKQS